MTKQLSSENHHQREHDFNSPTRSKNYKKLKDFPLSHVDHVGHHIQM